MHDFILNNGNVLPAVGLGTFPMKASTLKYAVQYFVSQKAGLCSYILLDSARDYGNEADLGTCIEQVCLGMDIQRSDIFITTKIGNRQQKIYSEGIDIMYDIDQSLKDLKVEYIDMLLMHWPLPEYYIKTWRMMERVLQEGRVKNIGVCNFRVRHLKKLLEYADIVPAVNQIEIHPLRTAKKDVAFCHENGIQVQAYCPLGLMDNRIKNSNILKELAKKYGKTIPQIILRWDYQNGIASVPKSSSPERIESNYNIFDFNISEDDMSRIDNMNIDYKFYSESFYCPGY